MPPSLDRDLSRREFGKAAVALGGASALAACLDRFGQEEQEPVPSGVASLEQLPTRQHAWRDHIRLDDHGNSLLPRHQILLYLNLDADGPPGADARNTVSAALSTLDEAYERSHEGLIHSMAYSPAYFDRFESSLPDDLDLPPPRRLSAFEQPDLDDQDALLHLASDRPEVVLEADEALTGDRETANGVAVDASLTDVFSVDARRTGFIGAGMPAERQGKLEGIPDSGPVPEKSPLFMGFQAGFRKNQASEDYVTLKDGPFAGGTTKHVSNIRQRLDDWYGEQDFDERVMEMFSPTHAEEGLVEGVGNSLGADNGLTSAMIENTDEAAREFGRVGHAQKNARANRDPDGNVRLLRRHFESTDDDIASLHFPTLQRGIGEFEAVREAMNGADLTEQTPAVRQRVNNGILEYIFVEHRGNFLVPPMDLRVLPTPTGANR
ncbi:DUF7405 family protein [Halococcus agarilyticus]|uniref:DUF7405 family protein n=1 Tax=Halococcus agarilyticus TaxID=1232219 RepID=UPI0006779978|nr:Tat pathway signal protein [Halococcus agarilyticus]